MKSFIKYLALALLALAFAGCKTNSSMLKCPDLAARKSHTGFLMAHRTGKTPKASSKNAFTANATASLEKDKSINIKLPALATRSLANADDLKEVNQMLGGLSDDKVSIIRRDNGKMYVTASTAKDFFKLTGNVSKSMGPRGYYEKRYGGGGGAGDGHGIAVAGAVLGIVGFVFSFLPILDFAAILMGIAAIILGAIAIHRGHLALGIIGVVFGILALIIAPITILVYHALIPLLILL